jgi:hypothetical protein
MQIDSSRNAATQTIVGTRQLFQSVHARTEFFNYSRMSKARRCKAAKTEEPHLPVEQHQAAEWSDFSTAGSMDIARKLCTKHTPAMAPGTGSGSGCSPPLITPESQPHITDTTVNSQWLGP